MSAHDINNLGQIVGYGMHNGRYEAVVLTPNGMAPPPGATPPRRPTPVGRTRSPRGRRLPRRQPFVRPGWRHAELHLGPQWRRHVWRRGRRDADPDTCRVAALGITGGATAFPYR